MLRTDTPTGGPRSAGFWLVGQLAALAVTLGLIAGLVFFPEAALNALWGVLIPVLPASFLLGTGTWRSICPLATLNMLPNQWAGRRKLWTGAVQAAGVMGIAILAVLVPARRFLFNHNGPALAATIATVAGLALALGALYDAKAGFCNAICPVLPVERLYGQYPLLPSPNPRCPSCTGCTPLTCIDLAPARSLVHVIGPPLDEYRWLARPLGVFAAAFPGFVAGYYTAGDVPLTSAGSVYLHMLSWAAASYLGVFIVVRLASLESSLALPLLASVAVGTYYWFASPLIVEALGLSAAAITPLRIATGALVFVWLCTAVRRRPGRSAGRLSS